MNPHQLLAQVDADWIEVVILILVVGGSALGTLLKWLVRKFTPEEAERERAMRSQAPPSKSGEVGDPRPARPVARPLPIPGSEIRGPQPPLAKAYPGQPVPSAQTAMPMRPGAPPPAPASAPSRPAVRSPQPPATIRRSSEPPVRPTAGPRPADAAAPDRRRREVASAKAKTVVKRPAAPRQHKSEVERRHLDEVVSPGHLEDQTSPQPLERLESVETEAPESPDTFMAGPALSPAELRRAVVLRELLGPPVALRTPVNPFGL